MFFVSPTCRMTRCRSDRRMSRVTRSSSDIGRSVFTPGVSMTACRRPVRLSVPRLTSTVVPG